MGGANNVDIREGDVFRFSYSDEYRKKLFEPHHCFDGQLVAVPSIGGLILMDTYWLHGFEPRHDGRSFTVEEAQERGTLTLVCNLNETTKVSKSDIQYYDDDDWFNLSYQHGCYPWFAIRNGATKSKEKIVGVLREKMAAERRAIELATFNIERLGRYAQLAEDGRLSEVYL